MSAKTNPINIKFIIRNIALGIIQITSLSFHLSLFVYGCIFIYVWILYILIVVIRNKV